MDSRYQNRFPVTVRVSTHELYSQYFADALGSYAPYKPPCFIQIVDGPQVCDAITLWTKAD